MSYKHLINQVIREHKVNQVEHLKVSGLPRPSQLLNHWWVNPVFQVFTPLSIFLPAKALVGKPRFPGFHTIENFSACKGIGG